MNQGNQCRAAHKQLADFYTVRNNSIRCAMQTNEIEAIDRRIQQLRNRRAQLLARHSAEERKRGTRQAIILGKWVMARKPELATAIAQVLERDQDRAVFGLQPLPRAEDASANTGDTQVDILLPLDASSTAFPDGIGNVE